VLKREEIITEFIDRLSNVDGVVYVARNPKKPPSAGNLPAIQLFEFPDDVISQTQRGGYPVYRRMMEVIVESFIAGSDEGAASKEEIAFLAEIKKKVYAGGNSLGKRCVLTETAASRVLRPATGSNVAGIGVTFNVEYVEDISLIMA